jgi:hypothetical protein
MNAFARRFAAGRARGRGEAARAPLRVLIPSLALSMVLAVAAGAGTWPCGASRVFKSGYSGAALVPTFAAVYDTTIEDSHTARLTFDRAQGRSTISASSAGVFGVELRVVDCLDVAGVPAGTPLDASLQFDVDGWTSQQCGGSGCGVLLEATVTTGADSASADANQAGPGDGRTVSLDATPTVPIHFVAGNPVTVQFVYRYGTGPGGGGAQAEAAGVWRVAGLPAGVSAIGSAGSNLTPARSSTWGRVKALHR